MWFPRLIKAVFKVIVMTPFMPLGYLWGLACLGFGAGVELAEQPSPKRDSGASND